MLFELILIVIPKILPNNNCRNQSLSFAPEASHYPLEDDEHHGAGED